MRILTANLKHLYQHRMLWLVYAYLGIMLIFNILLFAKEKTSEIPDFYIVFVMFMFLFSGQIVVSTQLEVLNKPFAYCLPGHRKVPKIMMFVIGIAVCLMFSLPYAFRFSFDLWHNIIVFLSAFSFTVIIYWLSILFSFWVYNRKGWIIAPVFILVFFIQFYDINKIIAEMIIESPRLFISLGLLSSAIVWYVLGDDGLARRYCDRPIMLCFNYWDKKKIQKCKLAMIKEKADKLFGNAPAVERFFLGQIQQCRELNISRYVWGGLYQSFGPLMSMARGKNLLFWTVLVLSVLLFYGYIGELATYFLFLFPGILVLNVPLPLYSNMLISGGRKERFITNLMQFFVITALLMIAVIILTELTMLAEPFVPDISLKGRSFPFTAADLHGALITLVIIPVGLVFNLLLHRQPLYKMVILFFIFAIIWGPLRIFAELDFNRGINIIYISFLIALLWFALVGFLHYICTKRSLVK